MATVEFLIDCRPVRDGSHEEFMRAIVKEGNRQGLKCNCQYGYMDTAFYVSVECSDYGQALAFEAAVKNWALERKLDA